MTEEKKTAPDDPMDAERDRYRERYREEGPSLEENIREAGEALARMAGRDDDHFPGLGGDAGGIER